MASHYPIPSQSSVSVNKDPMTQEITLLPRHWHWLAQQGGSASATFAARLTTYDAIPNNKDWCLSTTSSLPIAFARPCAVIFRAMKKPYEPCTRVIAMGSKHIHPHGHRILPPEPAQLPSRFGLTIRRTERKPKPQQVPLLLGTVLVGRAGVGNRMVRQQLNITGL